MVRLAPLAAIIVFTAACSAGELGATSDEGDAAAIVDATSDTSRPDGDDEVTTPSDSSVPIDTTPPPFDGAPADLGGDGGCTFGGSSLASAIVTTDVASASPTGEAILTERPGGLAVAWRSSAGYRVTPLDASGARAGADLPLDVLKVYGLAAGADGYALLASRAPDYMTFLRISGAGVVVAKHDLVGGGDHAVVGTEWFGEFANTGRLVANATGFAAYFGIHRRWPDGIAHQGDTLRLFTSAGATAGSMWGWGCSHSLDQRIGWNGTKVGALCLSDCYPKKAIMLNHNETTVSDEPSGNCAGSVNATLGAVVGNSSGFFAMVLSREGRTSRDVKLVRVGNDAAVKSTTWLTTTSEDESSAHLASFGGAMLAGWMAGGTKRLARVDSAGAVVGTPETVTAPWGPHDFVGLKSGDAAWASTDSGKLTIVRVRACP
jgi:hypothetical protein